jgi:K+:H+ antiporter
MPWREATALGVLMNTRGLMELVILNIGLDVGAISPPLFTMMVLMALVTTFMTTPLVKALVPGPAEGGRSSWVSATDTQVSDPRR